MDELDAIMDEAEQPAEVRFTIDDDRKADWAVRKINRHQRRIDDAKKLAAEKIERIKAWLDDVTADNEREIEFFGFMLRPYIEEQLSGCRAKTYKLPSGIVSMRRQEPVFWIGDKKAAADNPALVEYVQKFAPDYLRMEPTAAWGELKAVLVATESGTVVNATTGELIPAIRAEVRLDAISIKEMK